MTESEQDLAIAVYWQDGDRIKDLCPSRDSAAEHLWNLWCDVRASPIAVTDPDGNVIMNEKALDEDRLERMAAQHV